MSKKKAKEFRKMKNKIFKTMMLPSAFLPVDYQKMVIGNMIYNFFKDRLGECKKGYVGSLRGWEAELDEFFKRHDYEINPSPDVMDYGIRLFRSTYNKAKDIEIKS
ncbi:MAG: hypothetical protein AB7V16_07260 [Vulcanibacillus sp.]